ncbi:MAG TPA: HlyD family efflux transporter periplasmic adaptor subunit [Candidatus Acidoferrum sp.]|nr:HlyD family efflux transporter periplasmic adaptor subunit [Candidatus Acidoferrum sp.]
MADTLLEKGEAAQIPSSPDAVQGASTQNAATESPTLEETLVFKPEKKKKFGSKVRKVLLWGTLAVIVGGVGLIIYSLFFKEEKVEMQTATAYYTTIESSVTGSSSAAAKQSQEVAGLAKGRVLAVYVKPGDMVKVGDPLFSVDDESIRDDLTTYGESLDRAQKDLTALYEELDGQDGRAAFNGKVLDIGVAMGGTPEVGDTVTKGQILAVLVDDSKMRLTTYFSTAYKGVIAVGQEALVSIPGSMALIPGTVDRVANNTKITAEGTVLFEVEIAMDNPGALMEGLVATATVTTGQGDVTPAESGKLEYNRKENVKAKTSGELTAIYMRDYYDFAAGDAMFTIYNEDLDGKISTAIKAVEDAREKYDDVADEYEYYQPVAEIAGQVISVSIAEGDELAGSSGTVVQVADMSTMLLDATVDELDIAKLTVGMPVEVTADSTGMTYEGKVVEIQMQGTVANGMSTFPVKIEVPNPGFNAGGATPALPPEGGEVSGEVIMEKEVRVSSTSSSVAVYDAKGGFGGGVIAPSNGGLYPGMWLNFKVVTSRVENCLAVPSNAVKYVENGTVVFVRQPDENSKLAEDIDISIVPEGFTAVYVTVGVSDDTQIQIVEGLAEGAEVATTSATNDPYGGMYY